MADRHQMARIHIMKAEAKLDDKAYRDLLFKSAGIHSAKDIVTSKQYTDVISALEALTGSGERFAAARKPKREENLFQFSITPPREPWTYVTPTDFQWANMGDVIEEYAFREHKIVVFVMEANGERKMKLRPMVEGRDWVKDVRFGQLVYNRRKG